MNIRYLNKFHFVIQLVDGSIDVLYIPGQILHFHEYWETYPIVYILLVSDKVNIFYT